MEILDLMQLARGEGSSLASGVQVEHLGVICDGCQARDFRGIRYRCLVCLDYDLCEGCFARRDSIHQGHRFEELRQPRSPMITPRSPLLQTLFGASPDLTSLAMRGLGHTIVTVMEINLDEDTSVAQSGLDDAHVSWWLAGDDRLADAELLAKQDPSWTCPICSEGLEAEDANGWLVRICNMPADKPASTPVSPSGAPPSTSTTGEPGGGGGGSEEAVKSGASSSEGHLYHEECLRRWLLRKNACPVCRRGPVVPG